MKLYLQQKLFSIRSRSTLYDAAGNPCYYSEAPMASIGTKLFIKDLQDRELATIRQKIFSFLPTYFIEVNGEIVATVVKKFTLFRHEYVIDGIGWTVHGDMFDHDYEIYDGDRLIACVSKEWFTLGDAYAIDISPEAPVVTALAVVLVIDACLDAQDN